MKKILFIFALLPSLAFANEDLLKKYGCLSCHGVDKKIVGPAFKDVAAKYKSKNDNVAYLAGKIRNGAQGTWGGIPMPAQKQVVETDAQTIAKWILTK